MTPESSASRRFWRFSLGQLLVLFSILGVLLVILALMCKASFACGRKSENSGTP